MAQANTDLLQSPCLKFKGNLVPITTLELLHFDPVAFGEALEEKISQAPNLFVNHPVILSLEKYEDPDSVVPDLRMIQTIARNIGLILVGIRADKPEQLADALLAGLPVFPSAKTSRSADLPEQNDKPSFMPREAAASTEVPVSLPRAETVVKPVHTATMVITQPVRSGQQIYAPGGDLIVLAPVSAGAELLADGNIHVYAPLRGRALAGVRGLETARIFCQSLEAELVSIAGQYKVSEDLQGPHWKKATQIALNGEKLAFSDI